MLTERGVKVDHTTIFRWVQRYAPQMEKKLRWYYKRNHGLNWKVDETYIKVAGKWVEKKGFHFEGEDHEHRVKNDKWAELPARVFGIDVKDRLWWCLSAYCRC